MTFVRFGLFVTGEGEEKFLPELFRSVHQDAPAGCQFTVIARIGQARPRGDKRKLVMAGSGKLIADRDVHLFGIPARNWLTKYGPNAHVILIDDLEWDRRVERKAVFDRHSQVFDHLIKDAGQRARVGVFFLVMMLEAYYFGDPATLRAVLGLDVPEPDGDVEDRRHPKNDLKRLHAGFDEKRDGERIVRRLDLQHVLANPETCRSLRTILAWIHRALGIGPSDRFQLTQGKLCDVTKHQIDVLPGLR